MSKRLLHVSGTHCSSCKIFIEDTLNGYDPSLNARVDLHNKLLEITAPSDQSSDDLAKQLTKRIQSHGYSLSVDRVSNGSTNGEVRKALLIGLALLAAFFLLQKSGLLNVGIGGKVTPATSFVIGLVASVSSCLAVVGGLVLSLSAKLSQDSVSDKRTFTLFHLGRLIGFGVLGGVLGAIGSAISVNYMVSALLGLLASLVMVLLGLSLVGVINKRAVSLPAGLFRYFRRIEHGVAGPLALGLATFFLPCGFTQSMQISALSSGSFSGGLIIMLSFALGTLPMLAILSFGSTSFAHSKHASLFFKSAGVVVIGLGLFAFISGLTVLGVIDPIFSL
jgi:sulfite exporter TauE/SafE